MKRIEAPDGTVIEFPADMEDADIAAVMRREYGGPEQGSPVAAERIEGAFADAEAQPASEMYKRAPGGYGMADYARSSLPFGDEVAALGGATGRAMRGDDFGKAYTEQKALERLYRDQYARDNPAKAFMGGAASVAAASPARLAAAAPTVLQGMRSGAGVGTLFGAGEGEGVAQRATNAAMGGAFGGALGGAVPTVANRFLGAKASKATPAPSVDDLGKASKALYAKSEAAGVTFSKTGSTRLADSIEAAATRAKINPSLHPDATAALKVIMDKRGQIMPLSEVDELRQVIKDAAASLKKGDRRIAMIMADRLDDVTATLGTKDVIGPDPKAAVTALQQARGLWSRQAKGETIAELFDRARTSAPSFSGSGYENALRTQFKQLAMSPKRMRAFTVTERAAIKKVARGGPMENLLRQLGKFAPTGVVSSGISGGIGYAAAGPVGALALPAAGFAARQAATAMTARNARLADELVRRGVAPPGNRPLTATERFLINQGSAYSARK